MYIQNALLERISLRYCHGLICHRMVLEIERQSRNVFRQLGSDGVLPEVGRKRKRKDGMTMPNIGATLVDLANDLVRSCSLIRSFPLPIFVWFVLQGSHPFLGCYVCEACSCSFVLQQCCEIYVRSVSEFPSQFRRKKIPAS